MGIDAQSMIKTIFISYSHDSEEHRHEVLQLATKLIEMGGVDVTLDLWAGSPAEGWTLWMEKSIRDANFCLIVCSSAYYQKVMQDLDAGVGKGVKWEGRIIRNILYNDDCMSAKFIPVLLSNGKPVHILTALKDSTFYRPNDPAELENLYRAITHQPAYEKPPVKPTVTPLPPRNSETEDPSARSQGQSGFQVPNSIKAHIASGNLRQALEMMAADSRFAEGNEVILLQAQYHRLQRDIRIGILTHQQASIQQNRITHAMLSMLEE